MLKKERKLNLAMIATIMSLAWPTMLEQAMMTAVQYIDTAMVGSLGTFATAAVGSTTTVSWLIGSSTAALGVGFLSYIARSHGAGNRDDACRASAQAVLTTLVVGLLFTVLCLAVSPSVPVWMQGTRAFSVQALISPAPPLGISRSTRPTAVISSWALARVVSWTN